MTFLLIDTAFDCCQAGLWRDGTLSAHRAQRGATARGAPQHDVALAPLIAALLQDNNLAVRDLSGIAVITGPGRFTSLRVGIAFARALVLPHALPLVGIMASDVLQTLLPPEQSGWLVAVKRGEVFAQTTIMPEPVAVPCDAVSEWLDRHAVEHIAAIGAGVPLDWDALLAQRSDVRVLMELPLDRTGQALDRKIAAGFAPAPVRPFYGQSTGAWTTSTAA